MTDETDKPLFWRILPDIVAFVLGLCAAYFLKWETKDLVWSLWLGSLVLGYLTLLSVLAGGACIGYQMLRHKDFKREQRLPAILIASVAGVFFLGFFSLHFCGFHAGHSVFLQGFFPISGIPSDGFGRAFMNPPLLWFLVFKHLIRPYGVFLIPAIIAERKLVFLPLTQALHLARTIRADNDPRRPGAGSGVGPGSRKSTSLGDAMSRPYINVVRMHLLIFFFAFCHFLKVDSFLVYAVVYSVYFFPWREVKRLPGGTSVAQPAEIEL